MNKEKNKLIFGGIIVVILAFFMVYIYNSTSSSSSSNGGSVPSETEKVGTSGSETKLDRDINFEEEQGGDIITSIEPTDVDKTTSINDSNKKKN